MKLLITRICVIAKCSNLSKCLNIRDWSNKLSFIYKRSPYNGENNYKQTHAFS